MDTGEPQERLDKEAGASRRLTQRFGDEVDRYGLEQDGMARPAHDLLEKVATALIYSIGGQPAGAHVEDDDIVAGLLLLNLARRDLDSVELQLLTAARRRGLTWKTIAQTLGLESPQAAQQRNDRLTKAITGRPASDFPDFPDRPDRRR
jgi:hypothetical protein